MTLTVVLPAHNVAENLEHCVHAVVHFVPEAKVIIAEDGSQDATAEIAKKLSDCIPNIIVLSSMKRLGKGAAIKNALAHIKDGDVLITDVDLSVNMTSLIPLSLILRQNCGLVIASRHKSGSKVKRSLLRTITSRTFNLAVNFLFHDEIADHQCGFKLLSQRAVQVALSVENSGFLFDTELIIKCRKAGLNVSEYPVAWVAKKGSSVRLLQNSIEMLWSLLRLRFSFGS